MPKLSINWANIIDADKIPHFRITFHILQFCSRIIYAARVMMWRAFQVDEKDIKDKISTLGTHRTYTYRSDDVFIRYVFAKKSILWKLSEENFTHQLLSIKNATALKHFCLPPFNFSEWYDWEVL